MARLSIFKMGGSSAIRPDANPAQDVWPTATRAPRTAQTVPEQGYERSENVVGFIDIQEAPRPSYEQGFGKTPGLYDWGFRRVFQSLVPKREKQGAGWPNYRHLPTRPEMQGWGAAYLLFFEQANRHAWPGGSSGAPTRVINHPQTVPFTGYAPRL